MRRQQQEEKVQGWRDRGIPHITETTPGPRMPRSDHEVKMHLTGRYKHLFRNPINREERRWWDNYWKLRGRGFTKPERKGERF